MEIVRSFLFAYSFLTILPAPRVELPEEGVKYFCLMLPIVGILLGAIWAALALLLSALNVGAFLRGAVMTVAVLSLTGGMHMDGFIDTADAFFSRRSRAARLEILKDPHTGAFAVMCCSSALLIQCAAFAEIFSPQPYDANSAPTAALLSFPLASIPVWSRLCVGFVMNSTPFAREDGLTRTIGSARNPRHAPLFIFAAATLAALNFYLAGPASLWLPAAAFAVTFLWRRSCIKIFGGVTGDLLGALSVLAETVMPLALALSCI